MAIFVNGELVPTTLQLYLAIGFSCLTVIASLVVSMIHISRAREDLREIRSDIKLVTRRVEKRLK